MQILPPPEQLIMVKTFIQSVKFNIYRELKDSYRWLFCQNEEDSRKTFAMPALQKVRQLFSDKFSGCKVLRKINAEEKLGASKKTLCATKIFFGFTKIVFVVTEFFLRAAEEKPKSSHFFSKNRHKKRTPAEVLLL
ncbi:MAG: hypothetical protein J6C15_01050 [Bacteroidaceae bacterium]|nr:hypothetical protein [Bacteroidaceae bacterium]